MAKAHQGKHLEITCENITDRAASLFETLRDADVNVHATCMMAPPNEDVKFWLVVDNFDKARGALQKQGYKVKTKSVVLVAMPHRVGAYAEVLRTVASAGVDVYMSYSSTAVKKAVLVVMLTSSDLKAIKVINQEI